MYRLDLSDPRLNLPVAVYAAPDGTYHRPRRRNAGHPAFFAPERPGPGSSPSPRPPRGSAPKLAPKGRKVAFYALPADAPDPPRATLPLTRFVPAENTPSLRVWPGH